MSDDGVEKKTPLDGLRRRPVTTHSFFEPNPKKVPRSGAPTTLRPHVSALYPTSASDTTAFLDSTSLFASSWYDTTVISARRCHIDRNLCCDEILTLVHPHYRDGETSMPLAAEPLAYSALSAATVPQLPGLPGNVQSCTGMLRKHQACQNFLPFSAEHCCPVAIHD